MNFGLRHFEDQYGSAKPVDRCVSNTAFQNSFSVPANDTEISVVDSITDNNRRVRGDSRHTSAFSKAKRGNQDWIKDQATKLSLREGAELTGLSERAFENIRLGRNKISFDPFTSWCLNDPDFAAAYAEHIGLIRPGEAEFAGALTRAYNAYERRKAKT